MVEVSIAYARTKVWKLNNPFTLMTLGAESTVSTSTCGDMCV